MSQPNVNSPNFYEQVYRLVRQIPYGKVTSYGRIAQMLGAPRAARAVGYALQALKDKQNIPFYGEVPWHRVINHAGRISISNREFDAEEQALRLRAEGIVVNENLQVDMAHYLWKGLNFFELDELLAAGF